MINLWLEVYVLEIKSLSTGLTINEKGGFSTACDGREVGIASPIEQDARHVAFLRDAFKTIGLPTGLGVPMPPSFHPMVLVSPKSVIKRPATR